MGLKFFLFNKEVLFNSFGQIFVKKRIIFNFIIKSFKYIPKR